MSASARVAVVMAVHRPEPEAFARQIESIAAQRGIAVQGFAVIDGRETADDPEVTSLLERAGFRLCVNDEPLGVRGAFGRGLAEALEQGGADVFSFADQDDVWHPDKLAVTASALRDGVALAHCDARVIGEGGSEIAPSLHRFERRSPAPTLFGAMLLNSVTGMTAVFPRATAEHTLRVISGYDGPLLHDHIAAAVAAARGHTAFVGRPLVDYRQHANNQIGARPSRAVLRRREVGRDSFGMYRATSTAIFRIRRKLAALLDREGLLPPRLRTMFLLDRASPSEIAAAYTIECGRLFFRGQIRRWELGLRLMDTALFARRSLPEGE